MSGIKLWGSLSFSVMNMKANVLILNTKLNVITHLIPSYQLIIWHLLIRLKLNMQFNIKTLVMRIEDMLGKKR